jgi:hypothetical protein
LSGRYVNKLEITCSNASRDVCETIYVSSSIACWKKELQCARHPEKPVLVRRQKAVLLDTAMLELPYHVSRIEYGAIGRNSPLFHVVHNLLCKPLVANH